MIRNITKKCTLANNINFARTLIQKSNGLMFSFPKKDYALIFPFDKERIISLHMLFVFYRIDILWLNKDKEVVDLRKCAIPFMPLIIPKAKAKYVIELPCGIIKKTSTEIKDKIEWKE